MWEVLKSEYINRKKVGSYTKIERNFCTNYVNANLSLKFINIFKKNWVSLSYLEVWANTNQV